MQVARWAKDIATQERFLQLIPYVGDPKVLYADEKTNLLCYLDSNNEW